MPTFPPYVISTDEKGKCPKGHILCSKKEEIFITGLKSYSLQATDGKSETKVNSTTTFNVTKLENGYQIDYKASYSCVNLPSARPEGTPTYGKTYTDSWEIESTPSGPYQPYIITDTEIQDFSSPGILSSNFYTDPPGLINLPATWNLAPVGIIVYTGASRKEVEENLKSWEDNTEEAKSVIEIIYGQDSPSGCCVSCCKIGKIYLQVLKANGVSPELLANANI